MRPLIGWSALALSCATACILIIHPSTQDLVIVNSYPEVDESQDSYLNYKESKEKLSRTISQEDNLHVETKREIESLLTTLNEIMGDSEADIPYESEGKEAGRMPDDKTENFLKREYALLGLSYEDSKARVKSILNAEMTDPELIELSNKISKGVAQ